MKQYEVKVAVTFKREFKRLNKRYPSLEQDVKDLRTEILSNPTLGTDLGGGFRKIRMRITSKGRGKSGGARVITFTIVITIDKAERESISISEIQDLLKKSGLQFGE